MTDPFADDYQAPTTNNDAFTTPTQEASMTESADHNFVTVILKGGSGYGAPSVSIRGASIPDALKQVTDFENDLKELVDTSAKVGKYFGRQVDGEKAQPPQGNTGKPQGASEAPGGEKRYCAHGEMQFKSDVSKAGNAYKGFFCTERDRESQCKAQFIK